MVGDTPRRIVELGAGTGIFTRVLLASGHKVVAVEPDAEMEALLLARSPGVETCRGEAEAIPLPDASVDAVVCAQAHWWFDPERAYREIARVIRPGGVFGAIWNVPDSRNPLAAELNAIEGGGAPVDVPEPALGAQFSSLEATSFPPRGDLHARDVCFACQESCLLHRRRPRASTGDRAGGRSIGCDRVRSIRAALSRGCSTRGAPRLIGSPNSTRRGQRWRTSAFVRSEAPSMALALEGRMGGYMAVASADPRRPSTSATAGAKPIEANSSRASRSARLRGRVAGAGSAGPGRVGRRRARGRSRTRASARPPRRRGSRPRPARRRPRRAGRGRRRARARRAACAARHRPRAGRRAPAGGGRARCARARAGGGVVGVGADVRNLLELVQQRARAAVGALGEQQPRGGRERHRVVLRLAALARCREQLVGGRGLLVRAALGEQAQLHGARLDGVDVAGRLQALRQRDGLGQRLLGLAELGEKVALMAAIPSANSAMPRRSQKSIPSRQAARAPPAAPRTASWRSRGCCAGRRPRPWPCSSASASARRMSSSPCRSPREARARPGSRARAAGSGRPSSAASASARSAAAIASG